MTTRTTGRSRRLAVLAAAVLTVLGAAWPAWAELATSPWPMFGHDLRHTGRSTGNGPQGPNVAPKWAYKAPSNFKEGPPTIGPDGTVYIGVGLLPYCAVSPAGQKKWCTSGLGGGASGSVPTVGVDPLSALTGPVLYVGGRDNKTWAIKDNGLSYEVLWRNKVLADGDVHSSVLIDPDTDAIYSACGCVTAGQLVALDATPADMADGLGELLWPSALVQPSIHFISPAMDDRTTGTNLHYRRVYIGATDGKLHAFTPDDAHSKWTEEWSFLPVVQGTNNKSSPMIGDDGTIYMGSYLGLSAIVDNGSSGANKWPPYRTTGRVDATPALSVGGATVYVGTSAKPGVFLAINAASGSLKWQYPASSATPALAGPIVTPAAIGADGKIYVAAGKTVYAFQDNGTNATIIWQATLGGVVLGLSIGDGVLYATVNDHKLYQLQDVVP
jgi:outer membrane protein assembly factor BamB